MAEGLIIDNRTDMGTEYVLVHLGALLLLGADARIQGSPIEFDDGVQIHVIENEKSVRLLILHVEPVKPMGGELWDGHW